MKLQLQLIYIYFTVICFRSLFFGEGFFSYFNAIFLLILTLSFKKFFINKNFLMIVLSYLSLLIIFSLMNFQSYYRLFLGLFFNLFLFYFMFLGFSLKTDSLKIITFLRNITLFQIVIEIFLMVIDPNYQISTFLLRNHSTLLGSPAIFHYSILFTFLSSLYLVSLKRNIKLNLSISIISFFMVFLTLSRIGILSSIIILFLFLFYTDFKKLKKNLVKLIIPLGLLIIPFLKNNIFGRFLDLDDYIITSGDGISARTALFLNSFELLSTNFPFGLGLGMFGSIPTYSLYTPIYYELNLDKVYGLEPFRVGTHGGNFLVDTFWPSIIAEGGIFGLLLFLIIITYPIFYFLKKTESNSNFKNSHKFGLFSLFIVIFLSGFSTPLLHNPYGIAFYIFSYSLIAFSSKKLL